MILFASRRSLIELECWGTGSGKSLLWEGRVLTAKFVLLILSCAWTCFFGTATTAITLPGGMLVGRLPTDKWEIEEGIAWKAGTTIPIIEGCEIKVDLEITLGLSSAGGIGLNGGTTEEDLDFLTDDCTAPEVSGATASTELSSVSILEELGGGERTVIELLCNKKWCYGQYFPVCN